MINIFGAIGLVLGVICAVMAAIVARDQRTEGAMFLCVVGIILLVLSGYAIGLGTPETRNLPENQIFSVVAKGVVGENTYLLLTPFNQEETPVYYRVLNSKISGNITVGDLVVSSKGTVQKIA